MARKILVVDDSAINRQMLINTLGNDYDVLEAENGKQALTIMHRYYKMLSAVMLDIVMPEMDGYDVLRHVRENALLSQIPIIIVTGSEDEEARVKALSLGANDFILKPFNPDIIKHCLRNNIALRETASILNAIQKDKLTGLYNREAFFEKVTAMIKDHEPGYYILSCFDIDNFKLINDQYGAQEGDRLLREIGNAVKSNVDSIGGIGARIAADNFAAIFPADKRDTDVLQKIQDKKLVTIEQGTVVFSIGRYVITDCSLAASAIYDRAYIAKQSVKQRYDKHLAYFDETMLQKLISAQQIVSDMENAITQHQFEVWFQPQYNHVTGALIGAEALVRWRHPQKGIVPPNEFIPLFEQNGFIYELDKFVWREVCIYLRKWIDEGHAPLPVSVNISRYDVFRSDLTDVIVGLTNEYNIPIDLLRLEITESAFSKSTKLIVDIVKKLITLGFTIEIDDFGSGYSSLNTLKNVPAQVVKLDMRFLEDDEDVSRGGNILESIVRMTKWLGMSVIAEGVETKEQGDFLKSIGCNHVQGYLYARPMPASEYENRFDCEKKEKHLSTFETVDNLDNNMFWNPKSMDSLIFNSYVGSACIFEYCNSKIEILRATDRYAQMLGGDKMTVDTVLKLNLFEHFDDADTKKAIKLINRSIQTKEDSFGEFVFRNLPGCSPEVYIRSNMRVIASTDDRYLLYCLSENITAQRTAEIKERQISKRLQVIMDNINCGITAGSTNSKGAELIFANDKYYEILGYTKEQYRNEIENQTYTTVYPDDMAHVKKIATQTVNTGVPSSIEYRAIKRDGSIIWLRSFLSMTSLDELDGRVQICTYADITAEKHVTQDLLDNLPCGAALFEYSNDKIMPIHLNNRYWELVNRASTVYSDKLVFDSIHPDDRATTLLEIATATRQKRDATLDIRLQYGENKDEFRPFHVVGRIVRQPDGRYFIYAFYIPISDEAMSMQEMLPVALSAVMSSSSDLSFVKDTNLHYICCSSAFSHMVGLENEKDIIGKTDYDLFEKKLADQYVANDRELIESRNSIVDMTESIPSADGAPRYSSTSKYLLYDSAGNIVGLYGLGRDITQTRELEKRQDFLINNIPGGVAIYEGKQNTLENIKLNYFSDGFCALFGYTRDEYEQVCKQTSTSLVTKDYLAGLMKQIENLVKNDTPIDYIYRARVKDGSYRWIHVKAIPGERHNDNITVYAVLFDVTERQNTLEQLRISEEENRLAIQHSENVVCRYDVATKSLRVSPGANPIFGMSGTADDVPYGQVKNGKISAETSDAYIKFYEDIMHGKKSGSLKFQRKSSLGWRWLEAHSSTIFSSDGKPVSAVISFVDITESYEKDIAYKKWLQSL